LRRAVRCGSALSPDQRETRDIDFLGFGSDEPDAVKSFFANIMRIESQDGLIFDIDSLSSSSIREAMESGAANARVSGQ
jgi:hypothetical protein